MSRKTSQYCDRKTLLAEIIKSQTAGRVNNEVAKAIMQLAERYSLKSQFRNYTWRDEMVADAIAMMCHAVMRFDVEKFDNPFAYLTTVAHNMFLRRLELEKRQATVRNKLSEGRIGGEMVSATRMETLARDNVEEHSVSGEDERDHILVGPAPPVRWRPIPSQPGYSADCHGEVRRDEAIVQTRSGGWKTVPSLILKREGDFVLIRREESKRKLSWRKLTREAWPDADLGQDKVSLRKPRPAVRRQNVNPAYDPAEFRPIRDGRYLVSHDGRVIRMGHKGPGGRKRETIELRGSGAARALVVDGQRVVTSTIVKEAWPEMVKVRKSVLTE